MRSLVCKTDTESLELQAKYFRETFKVLFKLVFLPYFSVSVGFFVIFL